MAELTDNEKAATQEKDMPRYSNLLFLVLMF